MSVIDPDSPRQHGYDCGREVELGDVDSDGYLIGWIEPDGSCWESRRECEIARAISRYHDAFWRWNRTGGVLGAEPEPDPIEFVARYCSPDTEDDALRECEQVVELWRLGVALRAAQAACN